MPGSLALDGKAAHRHLRRRRGLRRRQPAQGGGGQPSSPARARLSPIRCGWPRGRASPTRARCAATELQPELTDADGNDANGDAPTVVLVDGSSDRKLRLDKTVLDSNGGMVQPGDELLYTITVANDGSGGEVVRSRRRHPGRRHAWCPAAWCCRPGARSVVDPAAGRQVRPRPGAAARAQAAESGETLTVLLRARLDANLPPGTSVCNAAAVGGGAGLDLRSPAESGCVLVGSPVGTGGIAGTVFRDLGEDNRKLDAERSAPAPASRCRPTSSATRTARRRRRPSPTTRAPSALASIAARAPTRCASSAARACRWARARRCASTAASCSRRTCPSTRAACSTRRCSGTPIAGAQVYLYYDQSDPSRAGRAGAHRRCSAPGSRRRSPTRRASIASTCRPGTATRSGCSRSRRLCSFPRC